MIGSLGVPTVAIILVFAINYHYHYFLPILFILWGVVFTCFQVSSLPYVMRNTASEKQSYAISLNYDKFSEKQQEIVESYNRNISEMIEQNKERIQLLDKELGNELEKSLESLGSSLSTLSSKFVEDYGPITQRLKGLLDDLNK